MPNTPRLAIDGGCYHLIVRGNQKQRIFRDEEDFNVYLQKLKKYKKKFGFKLYAYCLMPTHVHLIGQIEVGKNLSKFMHAVNLTYATYFNTKYRGVGHIWKGRFKSKIIAKDKYLVDCFHYVELNPVRAEIVSAPHEYPWSSYRERVLGNGTWRLLDEFIL